MTKWLIGSSLTLALLAFAAHTAFAQDEQKTTLQIAAMIEKGEKGAADKAAALRKAGADLEDIMKAFKPRAKGGIGVGKASPVDGIELKLQGLATKGLAKMALEKEKADLIKAAYVTLAIGEIGHYYAPEKKGAAAWKKYNEEMKVATRDFIKAVNAVDKDKVKKTAADIVSACNACHSDFK